MHAMNNTSDNGTVFLSVSVKVTFGRNGNGNVVRSCPVHVRKCTGHNNGKVSHIWCAAMHR